MSTTFNITNMMIQQQFKMFLEVDKQYNQLECLENKCFNSTEILGKVLKPRRVTDVS